MPQRPAIRSLSPSENLLAPSRSTSAAPTGFNLLAGQAEPNRRFPGAAPQIEDRPASVRNGVMAPAGHPAQGGSPVRSAPTATPVPPSTSPVDVLVSALEQRQLTAPEMLRIERAMTVAAEGFQKLLRLKTITASEIAAVERKVRTVGAGQIVDAFLQRMPPASDQARLRRFLEAELQVVTRSLAALHVAARKRRLNLAGLVASGKVGR